VSKAAIAALFLAAARGLSPGEPHVGQVQTFADDRCPADVHALFSDVKASSQ
jgi:hypothetical protein